MPERCPRSSRKHGILASDAGLQESEKSVHAGRGEETNAARTPGGVCCRRDSSPCCSRDLHEADALDAILALLVDVLQALHVLLGGVPVPLGVCLQEGLDHVAEGVGVLVEHLLADVCVGDVGLIGVLVHEVVHGAGRSAPAHGVAQALGDLTHALVAALERRLVKLRVQDLGSGVQANLSSEAAHLRVRRRGVRDVGSGLLAVLAETLDDLGGIAVKVVGHVRQ
mmetsp:Transcript_7591/g.19043  ORF Transcript_7591/g.19043 Transcript_7591/m.19043 type:complete len:225 (-) Transcript_7591:337-1011(-)